MLATMARCSHLAGRRVAFAGNQLVRFTCQAGARGIGGEGGRGGDVDDMQIGCMALNSVSCSASATHVRQSGGRWEAAAQRSGPAYTAWTWTLISSTSDPRYAPEILSNKRACCWSLTIGGTGSEMDGRPEKATPGVPFDPRVQSSRIGRKRKKERSGKTKEREKRKKERTEKRKEPEKGKKENLCRQRRKQEVAEPRVTRWTAKNRTGRLKVNNPASPSPDPVVCSPLVPMIGRASADCMQPVRHCICTSHSLVHTQPSWQPRSHASPHRRKPPAPDPHRRDESKEATDYAWPVVSFRDPHSPGRGPCVRTSWTTTGAADERASERARGATGARAAGAAGAARAARGARGGAARAPPELPDCAHCAAAVLEGMGSVGYLRDERDR